jgi:hypothetical protein
MNEINRRMPDAHIEALILEPTDILITHDTFFARFLGPRKSILLRQGEMDEVKKEVWYVEVASGCPDAKGSAALSILFFLFFFYSKNRHLSDLLSYFTMIYVVFQTVALPCCATRLGLAEKR